MKFWFFVVILANVIFFLWEVQNGALHDSRGKATNTQSEKQILLLSELPEQETLPKEMAVAENSASTSSESYVSKETEEPLTIAAITSEIPGQQEFGGQSDQETLSEDVIDVLIDEQSDLDDDLSEIFQLYTDTDIGTQANAEVSVDTEESVVEADQLATQEEPSGPAQQANKEITEAEFEKSQVTEQALSLENETLQTEAADTVAAVCVEVGPFTDRRQINRWLKKQQLDYHQAEIFLKEQQLISSYLVYFSAAETITESKQNMEMLKNKGVADLWLFRKGPMRGAISLGLFSQKYRAEHLIRQMAEKGVEVHMSERYKTVQSPFVRLRKPIALDQSDALGVSECDR